MRLRSLGKGHSLCFVAPPEVHRGISDMAGGKDVSQLSSFDVLVWSISQTCQALDTARSLRAMHGLEMLRQQQILKLYLPEQVASRTIVSESSAMKSFWNFIQEDDAQTLENLYGVNNNRIAAFRSLIKKGSGDQTMEHLIAEVNSMNRTLVEDSTMSNEQERELEFEIETQRQVQRPPKVEPLAPFVSRGLLDFITAGTDDALRQCDTENAFDIFLKTTAKEVASRQKIRTEDFTILATRDFAYSVKLPKGSRWDEYLRPVTWVLSSALSMQTPCLLIISPHEANSFLAQIKDSDKIRLHSFAARVSKRMACFSDLDFYTPNSRLDDVVLPAHVIRDLELFAGSLYLDDMLKYEKLCHFLGICTSSTRPLDKPVQTDGFANAMVRRQVGWPADCPFDRSPLPYIKHVLSLRMHGQTFSHSHMGALLNGRTLQDAAFEGCKGDDRAEDVSEVESDSEEERAGGERWAEGFVQL
jgi:hypothetical protein